MPLEQLIPAAALAFMAYIIKGFTGFGAGIVIVPVLTLFLDLKVVVFAACVCAVTNGTCLATTEWRNARWRPLVWIIAAALVGLALGTHGLVSLSPEMLKRAFGVLVCLFAVHMLFEGPSHLGSAPRPWPQWLAPISGFIGGSFRGLFGAGGPAMVIYLAHRLRSKTALRASLIMLFLSLDVVRLGGYVVAKLLTAESAQLACWILPASLLGSYVGAKAEKHVDAATFRRVVAVILFATGLLLAIR